MSDSDPKKRRKGGIGRNPTSTYRGGSAAWWGWGSAALDGSPIFTWLDVPRMLRDPQVRFLERMWRAPFQKVKWKVKSDTPAVAKFVGTTLRRFWRRSLPKLLSRYWRFGYAPGGAEFCAHRGHWKLERVRTIEPQDASPRVWVRGPCAGQPAGYTLSQGAALTPGSGTGAEWVGPPHAFWFSGYAELTPWHDQPPISGLFEPWLEKCGRNGAKHSRRQWFRQAAWRGAILRHPPGQTNIGSDEDPQMRDNQDIARESLDYMESGSKLTLESTRNTDGKGYEWEYEDAQPLADVAGIREYPQDLDREMSTGAGIPPEVLEASEVGSGWSGRLIPLLGYLGTVDEVAGMVVESADPWMRPLVRVNFGPKAWYEVEPLSLVDEMQQQQGKGGSAPQNPAQLFDGKPPPEQPPEQKPLSLSATIPPRSTKPHKYACVYAPCAAAIGYVGNLQRQIAPADLADRGFETEPHVTIRYGLHGDDSDLDVALDRLASRPPFEVRFEGPAHFAGADCDVVVLPVMSGFDAQLRDMHAQLGALNHTDTHPTYQPHLTVAYVKSGKGAEYVERLVRQRKTLSETVSELVYSDRDGGHTTLPLKERAPAVPIELSWTPYIGVRGPHAGQQVGWVSDTGEVRYQENQPGDSEGGEQGPESVFAHPDFAHIPEHTSAAEPRDFAQIRADAHAQAEAAGIDPAELHRRTAAGLHRDMATGASFPERWTAARHLQNHDAQANMLRLKAESSTNRAKAARAQEAEHRTAAAEFAAHDKQRPGTGWDTASRSRTAAADVKDREAAGHEQAAREALAKADEHKVAADKIRGGEVPKVHSTNRRNMLAGAYQDTHKALVAEKETRDDAAQFADTYFEEDNPAKRAASYIEHLDNGALDADFLPEDTRAAIAEDLSHLPPAKLADHVFSAVGGYSPDNAEHQIAATALAAASAARPVAPLPFNGSDPDKYIIVTPDNAGEDEFRGMQAAARLLPGVKAPLGGAMLVKASSPLGKLADEHGAGESLGGSEQHLFTALKTGYQLPVEHVPASAKDYGGTSGSKGSGEYQPEEGWDVNAVPVYKRVNEDWYVKLNPGTGEVDAGYELVHKDKAPSLARLPDVYWKDLDAETPGASEEAVERAQKREAKQGEEGAVQKRDVEDHKAAIKKSQAEVGKLKTAWNQALKGVPDDERPDEPDWDAVDASALTDQHDSREEHADALDALRVDYHDHIEGLKDEVEGAKEHAANHRANAAASKQAQEEWDKLLADVPEEDRPDEPDWRDTLGGDQEHHAKFLKEHLGKAQAAAEKYGAVHKAAAEGHAQRWRDTDQKIKGWLDVDQKVKDRADADDALNTKLNDQLFDGANSFESRFSNDRDDYPEGEAGDHGHAAVAAVQDAIDDVVNGPLPEHEDGPDHDEYTHDEADALGEGDTPEERAGHNEQAADEHKDRLVDLAKAVREHKKAVTEHSAKWRAETAALVGNVYDAAEAALKLPAGSFPDGDHAHLKDLRDRTRALLAEFDDKGAKELSFVLGPDGEDATGPAAPVLQVAQQTGGRLMRMRKAKLAQLLTLAMIQRQQQASERGNPRAANRSLAQLAQMANDPDQVARLVGLPALPTAPAPDPEGMELSWQPYIGKRGARAGQQVGWFNPDSREVRYQTAKPGEGAERARGRTASGSAGLAIAHKVLDGTASAEDLGELIDHLRVMTVPRLKNVAVLLEKKLSGLKRRDKMVAALLGHVGGITAADGTKADGTAPKQAPAETKPAETAPQPGEVRTVPTGSLTVDPKRFQFKLGTNNPAGVTKELEGVKSFNPEFAGVISAWLDPQDGKTYVVNGHHRHELAERTGHPNLAVRYLQAKDAREARAKGALINIAEGRGTAVDAAKFMRDMQVSPEDLAKHGVSLKGKLAADAATLTKLNDAAFDRVARGTLDPERALAVARHLDNPERQEKLFKLLAKREDEGKDLSDRTVEELARQMQAAPGVSTTNSTLWGDETNDDDTFIERGELAAHVRAALSQEHNDFGAVASDRRAGKVAGAGNTLNVEENKKRAAEAESAKNLYELSAHRKGGVADALDAGAVKLKQAKTKKERERARTETLEAVRTALRARLASPDDGGGKGGVDQGSDPGSGVEPPAQPAERAADAGRAGEQPAGVAAPKGRKKRKSLFADEKPAPEPVGQGKLADGRSVTFVPHETAQGARAGKYATVTVDPKKLDAAWAKDAGYYVPPGGGGAEIAGRRSGFEEFLKGGEHVQAPKAVLTNDKLGFDDGRHRFSVLRDAGIDRIPVTVPKEQAAEFYKRFGLTGATTATRTPRGVGIGADDANPTEDEFAAASRPSKPAPASAPPAGAVASPTMSDTTPPAGTPEANAAADHAPAITAIPKGDSRFIAGHRVRHTADGKFQVERKGGYLTGDAATIGAHIRKSWENQKGYPSTPAALARAAAYAEPDPFADPAAAARDAKMAAQVPEGTKAVSLDADTHGRLGTVRKGESGRSYLEFDGGEELKGADFEPLDAAHSWRASAEERAARAPKGGSTADLFNAAGPAPKSAVSPPVTPAPKPAPAQQGDALFNNEQDNLFNSEPEPATSPAAPARPVTDRGSLDSIRESTDRALGIKKEVPPEAPKKGQYGVFLRGVATDPTKFAELEKLAPLPTLDRNELLAAVAEVYGPEVHAAAKKKSKQGIVELLKAAKPV